MTRTLAAAALSALVAATPAFAADPVKDANENPVSASAVSTTLMASIAAEAAVTPLATPSVATTVTPDWSRGRRPAVLPALYVGSALLQAYDAYSTLKALGMGGREANPMMRGATANPAAFV